ncbi:MAG: phosphoenolpyruvate--protein phosphotransferase [Xanthomonadales bacterium]|nr:phosphoenolpyruvate--protein phosphotransferase [Xanthomonadales bacterium]
MTTQRAELEGTVAAKGLAFGSARVVYSAKIDVETEPLPSAGIPNEVKRFEEALKTARAELASLSDRVSGALARDLSEIIDAHAMILDDPEFTDAVVALIRKDSLRATAALKRQRDLLATMFEGIDDPYLRARRDDLDHVVARVYAALARGGAEPERKPSAEGQILVCETVAPAELAQLAESGLRGLVCTASSPYSHTAIVARGLRLPFACGVKHALAVVHEGDSILLDADHGRIVVRPDNIDQTRFRTLQKEAERVRRQRARIKVTDARTRDGVSVKLHVNAENPDVIAAARRAGADGVGLFRTEFLFMKRRELPTEDEQFRAYRDAIVAMAGRPVTLRTLDLGADKAVGGPLEMALEENPALGLRGIRHSLVHRDIFTAQLRAMLRASAYGPMRILLPMVSAVEEVREARELIEVCSEEVRRSRHPVADEIPLGAMIEVPAAALVSADIARHADFLAVGSNDLAQYVLAADRNNAAVAANYDPLHPAFMRLLFLVLDNARQAKRPISVCGEIAGDPRYTPLLLALGLTEFSMHPNALADVRETVGGLSRKSLKARASRLLHAPDRAALAEIVDAMASA